MVYKELENIVRAWQDIQTLRIAVVKTNSVALPFWHKQGFEENGEIKPWVQEQLKTEVIILTKRLQ